MPDNHQDYNDEPVVYCAKCYSLKIKHEEFTNCDCCMDCGSTEIRTAPIDKWERLYEGRYGFKFVEKSKDPRGSLFFTMPISTLKQRLYNSKYLRQIIQKLYPRFPMKYSKGDLVLMLFDRLYKDNRIDDLRYLLYDISRGNIKLKDNF